MKHILTALLVALLAGSGVLVLTANAQDSRPSPPVPYTVFPLGGLSFGLTHDSVKWNKYLPGLGLNTVSNDGVNGDNGSTGRQDVLGGGLTKGLDGWPAFSDFGANGQGYLFYYGQSDLNLASNERGAAAWDLGANWRLKKWPTPLDPQSLPPGYPYPEYYIGSSDWAEPSHTYYLEDFDNAPADYVPGTAYHYQNRVRYSGTDNEGYPIWECFWDNGVPQGITNIPPGNTGPNWGTRSDGSVGFLYWTPVPLPNMPNFDQFFYIPNYSGSQAYSKGHMVHDVIAGCTPQYWQCKVDQSQGTEPSCPDGGANWQPASPDIAHLVPNPTMSFFLDFIYRLDNDAAHNFPYNYAGRTDADVAYNLELGVVWGDGTGDATSSFSYSHDTNHSPFNSVTSGTVDVPITWGDFSNFLSSPSNVPSENPMVLNFPAQKWQIGNTQSYVIKRIMVQAPSIQNTDGTTTFRCPNAITLNLKQGGTHGGGITNSQGIYVRGVRLRTDESDHFFRHWYDTHARPGGAVSLAQACQNIHDYLGVAEWKSLHTIKIANEGVPFRTFAYVNEF
ncbi:MAG: hypothetical protein Q8922_12035 [Bacteroidota bacterium]|nr:hypothetical protein [Bacteroidota bacterium]MDP4233311.1 hypothetical protein [Bacteroidota bacterium]MDP4242069.1 hypothetical protein [Bacteroidota bacterium]MDP4288653.1 hypothetical protein [Bacteroidota bacterium]